MNELSFNELFESRSGSEWTLSDRAPDSLLEIIDTLEEAIQVNEKEYASHNFSDESKPIGYDGRIAVINTSTATLFFDFQKNRNKLLSVAVSTTGPLNKNQVNKRLNENFERLELDTSEMVDSAFTSQSLRSINQSYDIITGNADDFLESCEELKQLLDNPKSNREAIYNKQAPRVERRCHNLLSAVWTYQEVVESSLKELDVADTTKPYLKEYKDTIATATGIRHCIQHNVTLRIKWLARYSHDEEDYQYSIVIPVSDVKQAYLYHDTTYYDKSGDAYQSLEYFYGDIESRSIDLEHLTEQISNASLDLYESLQSELYSRIDVEPEVAKKNHVITSPEFFELDGDKDTHYL